MTKTIALGLVVLAAAACNPNAALKPKDGGVVTTVNAGSLPGIYIGALSDFQVAWSGAGNEANGGHEGNVGLSAIFTDELTAAGLNEFTFRRNLDSRQATPSNPQLAGIFNDLSGARHSTENAAADFAKFAPNDLGRAEMLALEGYTYIVFANVVHGHSVRRVDVGRETDLRDAAADGADGHHRAPEVRLGHRAG